MRKTRIKTISVMLRLSFATHRDILYGISSYAKTHHWRLHLINLTDFTEAKLKDMIAMDASDGYIISDCESVAVRNFLLRTRRPIVMFGPRDERLCGKRTAPTAFVDENQFEIGQFAARYLLSLGRFRSFGFVPENTPTFTSTQREAGLRAGLSAQGLDVSTYCNPGVPDGCEQDFRTLEKWLEALPKPAAIMAVYDQRAIHLLDIAHRAGIAIPSQVTVLSADNDELLCDFSDPTLSSIAFDSTKLGVLAASTLTRLLGKCAHGVSERHLSTHRIVERESTGPVSASLQVVNRMQTYIRQNACSGIHASDVPKFLGVSRRLADKCFRATTGKSILESITDIRLSAIQRQLKTTNLPINKITASCGFRSENYAKNLFKRRFGLSMSQFRQTAK